MTMTTATLFLLTVLIALSPPITSGDVTSAASSPASPEGCADSVIAFSPCLPYISAPPNDLTDSPSSQCCEIYNGAFDFGEAECLCYLVNQTTLLGFPLNASKLLSLSDLCSVNNNGSHTNTSLESICSDSQTLPPLISPIKKSPPATNARRSPPVPQRPPPPPPPTITKPRPPHNVSGNSSTKSPTSDQSDNRTELALTYAITLISMYMVILVRIPIFHPYITGMEDWF